MTTLQFILFFNQIRQDAIKILESVLSELVNSEPINGPMIEVLEEREREREREEGREEDETEGREQMEERVVKGRREVGRS